VNCLARLTDRWRGIINPDMQDRAVLRSIHILLAVLGFCHWLWPETVWGVSAAFVSFPAPSFGFLLGPVLRVPSTFEFLYRSCGPGLGSLVLLGVSFVASRFCSFTKRICGGLFDPIWCR